VIGKYLIEKDLKNLVVISPDTGGLKMAHAYSQMLDARLALIAKERKGPSEVEALTIVGDVKGCNAVIVDDLSTTAGTLCMAAKFLKEHGAEEVYAAVSHALLSPLGIERLRKSVIKELVVTDSVPLVDTGDLPIKVLSVAELLGEAMLRIHDNQSISSLFRL